MLRSIAVALLALVALPLIVILAPVLLLLWFGRKVRDIHLLRGVQRNWNGRRVLLVYSNSPNWKEYIEVNWLPKYGSDVVVLNWSERESWNLRHRFERAVFRRWAGQREFNPIGSVLFRSRKVEVFRFWQAFRDLKHGKAHALRRAEDRFAQLIAAVRAGA